MAVSWLLVEFVVLTALRAGSDGTFRFHIAGVDTILGSLIIDIVLYMLSIGAPFFVLRFPGESGLDMRILQDLIMHLTKRYLDLQAILDPVFTCRGASTSSQ